MILVLIVLYSYDHDKELVSNLKAVKKKDVKK
jgi:hypothetical protein